MARDPSIIKNHLLCPIVGQSMLVAGLAALFGAGPGPRGWRGRRLPSWPSGATLPRAFITAAAVVLALCSHGRSDPAPVIHYAPIENLEHVDVALDGTQLAEREPPAV